MGELMVDQLPRLSIDGGKIQVTWGEAQEYKRLHDAWFELVGFKSEENKPLREVWVPLWNAQLTERYRLKEKYLPHIKKFYLPMVELDDIKYGMQVSLWNSDICEYDIELDAIDIVNEDHFTVVSLKLGLNIPIQKIENDA